jgi:hypothetical protein
MLKLYSAMMRCRGKITSYMQENRICDKIHTYLRKNRSLSEMSFLGDDKKHLP